MYTILFCGIGTITCDEAEYFAASTRNLLFIPNTAEKHAIVCQSHSHNSTTCTSNTLARFLSELVRGDIHEPQINSMGGVYLAEPLDLVLAEQQ